MSIVSLVIAPYIAVVATNEEAADDCCKPGMSKTAMMENCKKTGMCMVSGKACTWDDAKQMCAHNDGTECKEMGAEGTKACCKSPEGAEATNDTSAHEEAHSH